MKTIFSIILGSIILVSFAQCVNSKETTYKIQEKQAFKTTKATYKEWVSGVKNGGSGIDVFFRIDNLDTATIVFDSVFFRNQKAKVERQDALYVGRFKTTINQKENFIMSGKKTEEYGNKAPIKKEKFPFDLKKNEAIVSYKENGEVKYFKLVLEREEPNFYPSSK